MECHYPDDAIRIACKKLPSEERDSSCCAIARLTNFENLCMYT